MTDDVRLQDIAQAYVEKYGEAWHFEVRDGMFLHEGGDAVVYEIDPVTAFGYAKGEYGQTRWRFEPA